jgi:hypothetical protein
MTKTPDSCQHLKLKDNKAYKLTNESRMLIKELWNQVTILKRIMYLLL